MIDTYYTKNHQNIYKDYKNGSILGKLSSGLAIALNLAISEFGCSKWVFAEGDH